MGILPLIYGFGCLFNCLKCQDNLLASSLRAPPQPLLSAEVLTHDLLDVPARHGLRTGTYGGEPRLHCYGRAAFFLQLWLLSDEDASAVTLWCRLRLDGSLNVWHDGILSLSFVGHHACCSGFSLGLDVFYSPFFLSNGRPVERVHAQIAAFGPQAAGSVDLAGWVEAGSPTRSQHNRITPELRLVEFFHWLHSLESSQEPACGFDRVHPPDPISSDPTSLDFRNIGLM